MSRKDNHNIISETLVYIIEEDKMPKWGQDIVDNTGLI